MGNCRTERSSNKQIGIGIFTTIPTTSCHHPKWIGNIPKEQFMRVHKNCSNRGDYEIQSGVLMHRFLEKGYTKRKLETLRNEVKMMNREAMLNTRKKDKKNKGVEITLLTGFNRQYKTLEKILKKQRCRDCAYFQIALVTLSPAYHVV